MTKGNPRNLPTGIALKTRTKNGKTFRLSPKTGHRSTGCASGTPRSRSRSSAWWKAWTRRRRC